MGKVSGIFSKRNQIYYYRRAIPSDVRHRFNKPNIEGSLRTKSAEKTQKLPAALSDRLERYWDSLRLEQIHFKELGLSLISSSPQLRDAQVDRTISDALKFYQDLKGHNKSDLFFLSIGSGCHLFDRVHW